MSPKPPIPKFSLRYFHVQSPTAKAATMAVTSCFDMMHSLIFVGRTRPVTGAAGYRIRHMLAVTDILAQTEIGFNENIYWQAAAPAPGVPIAGEDFAPVGACAVNRSSGSNPAARFRIIR